MLTGTKYNTEVYEFHQCIENEKPIILFKTQYANYVNQSCEHVGLYFVLSCLTISKQIST